MMTGEAPIKSVNRRDAFRSACALAGTTVEKWAESQGITPAHLYAVIRGDRESATLREQVDGFIAQQLPHVRVA